MVHLRNRFALAIALAFAFSSSMMISQEANADEEALQDYTQESENVRFVNLEGSRATKDVTLNITAEGTEIVES